MNPKGEPMVVEASVFRSVAVSAGAGLSWAVAITSSVQATLDNSTLVPIGIAFAALLGAVGLTWKAARFWSDLRQAIKNLDRRLEDIERKQRSE